MGNNTIGWLIQTAIMLGIGIIGYFLKDTNKKIEERIKQNEKSIEQTNEKIEMLEEKFNELKIDMPTKYVVRDDFIRAMSSVDTKLDKIYDIITVTKRGGQ